MNLETRIWGHAEVDRSTVLVRDDDGTEVRVAFAPGAKLPNPGARIGVTITFFVPYEEYKRDLKEATERVNLRSEVPYA